MEPLWARSSACLRDRPRRVGAAGEAPRGPRPAPALPPARGPGGVEAARPARGLSGPPAGRYLRGRPRSLLSAQPGTVLPADRRRPRAAPAAPSRWRRRRVRSPRPPHHVPHPGLRHRETRSRPAWVGAGRPARARRPRNQSAALRPDADTTPAGRAAAPAAPTLRSGCGPAAGSPGRAPTGHSQVGGPPANHPQTRQRTLSDITGTESGMTSTVESSSRQSPAAEPGNRFAMQGGRHLSLCAHSLGDIATDKTHGTTLVP
ncbi:uncharacterized protein LOC142426576 [Tenrec ecaudatus]|uniref:uncharacterized protein LOC142426576 n=1 Tax=Tenrec ecaudatus TaxID=94439 RepID=UPI003F5980F5